jgi:peptidoglycan/xylan/chitin deacetylase (PgdA/CDA1 family)
MTVRILWRAGVGLAAICLASAANAAAPAASPGNRLAYLNAPCDPYYVGLPHARLVTPQWVGEEGVDAVVVLSTDDMRDPAAYERFLRPILDRLARIDGRAPVSIMTNGLAPADPVVQAMLKAGVSIEAHTTNHPCPMLARGRLGPAKEGYDAAVDLTASVPNSRPVAFRTPCCDSKNVVSPRLFTEIINRTTPSGKFIELDSSVFLVYTANDPALPRSLATDEQSRPRFAKYIPADLKYTNYVDDYPYPYVIDNLCWEIPSVVPDDWLGQRLQKPKSPAMLVDMKAAVDATVLKQGVFVLTFHPHNWISAEQVVELIDYATGKHGRRVKFLNFREVRRRLTENVLGGVSLRAADGGDNGVRVLDVNADGYVDAVIGNPAVRQTRAWSPQRKRWETSGLPAAIVAVDARKTRRATGVQFGVLSADGAAAMLLRSEDGAGLWCFRDGRWTPQPRGLDGLEDHGPVATASAGRDGGVRLIDLDRDGVCEAIVGNPSQRAAFAWRGGVGGWKRLPFALPADTAIVDAQGRDAGCRLVDVDGDGRPDCLFSNPERFSLDVFVSPGEGWGRRVFGARRDESDGISTFVRADGSNNGAFFKSGNLYVHNEDTGGKLPGECEIHAATALLSGEVCKASAPSRPTRRLRRLGSP